MTAGHAAVREASVYGYEAAVTAGHAAVREASVYGYEAVVNAGHAAVREASVYGCKQEQGALLLLINHKTMTNKSSSCLDLCTVNLYSLRHYCSKGC